MLQKIIKHASPLVSVVEESEKIWMYMLCAVIQRTTNTIEIAIHWGRGESIEPTNEDC